MSLKIYHNPRCMKSRQTLALIEEKGVEVEIIQYLKEVPTEPELRELLRCLGMRPGQLIRRAEPIFKEKFKGRSLNDEEWIAAMLEHPKLIERPIVVKGDKAILGRPPRNVQELL